MHLQRIKSAHSKTLRQFGNDILEGDPRFGMGMACR